jgi:hypothetical protein
MSCYEIAAVYLFDIKLSITVFSASGGPGPDISSHGFEEYTQVLNCRGPIKYSLKKF